MSKLYMRWHQGRWPWMTLNGYKFEFSAKFALWNFKHIRQVATLPHVTLTSARLSCHLCRAVTYLPVNWTRQNYCTVIQYKSNDDDDHYNDDDETVSTLCRRWECVRIQAGSSISGSTHSKYGWRLSRSGVMATTSDGWCWPRFIIQLQQHHNRLLLFSIHYSGSLYILLRPMYKTLV